MEPALFRRFCELAHEKAGISLKEGKEELVAARVAKRQRALSVGTLREYLEILERDESGEELVHFLDVISTNFTSFFREPDHLDALREILQGWAAAGQRDFRMWSSASSSGEEPYSMAIVAAEALDPVGAAFKILATDISTRMLAECGEATYPESKVRTVPERLRTRYFDRVSRSADGEESQFRVKEALRTRLVFRRLNLSSPPFPMRGPLDVVFCRNVLIYFDRDVRQGLISEIERLLRPGGYLFVGHTETLTGIVSGFKMVRPSVFRRPETQERRS